MLPPKLSSMYKYQVGDALVRMRKVPLDDKYRCTGPGLGSVHISVAVNGHVKI